MWEYVPNDQNDNNWNEIITIDSIIGKKISARKIINNLTRTITEKNKGYI